MRRVRAHAVVGQQRARRRRQYAEYMSSVAWHIRRRRWVEDEEQRTGKPVGCAVCGSKDWEDLHHLTYDRMEPGAARRIMVALCRPHHEQLHRAYDAGRWGHLGYEADDAATAATCARGVRTAAEMTSMVDARGGGSGRGPGPSCGAVPCAAHRPRPRRMRSHGWRCRAPAGANGTEELTARANFEPPREGVPLRTARSGCTRSGGAP